MSLGERPHRPPEYLPVGQPAGWFPSDLQHPTRRWRTEWVWWDGEQWTDKAIDAGGLPAATKRSTWHEWIRTSRSARLLTSGETFAAADLPSVGVREALHIGRYWGFLEVDDRGLWRRAQSVPTWLNERTDPFDRAERLERRGDAAGRVVLWAVVGALVLWILIDVASRVGPRGDLFNCADFASQQEAQAELSRDWSDPHGLDRDAEAVACDRLP